MVDYHSEVSQKEIIENPAASQRCTNAGGVASVDKRSAQPHEHC
jgi:hypothetical protein